MKSSTCFRKDGKAKTEYYTRMDAQEGAEYASQQNSISFVPYQCRECNFWHIAPKDRVTPSHTCEYCTGRNGKLKSLYSSQNVAQRRADILRQEERVYLEVYECPHQDGWHLTHR
jgi:hypothetical protein